MNVTVYIFVYFFRYLYYKENSVNKAIFSQFTKSGRNFGFPANTLIFCYLRALYSQTALFDGLIAISIEKEQWFTLHSKK